jgi:hypothetical protein
LLDGKQEVKNLEVHSGLGRNVSRTILFLDASPTVLQYLGFSLSAGGELFLVQNNSSKVIYIYI